MMNFVVDTVKKKIALIFQELLGWIFLPTVITVYVLFLLNFRERQNRDGILKNEHISVKSLMEAK